MKFRKSKKSVMMVALAGIVIFAASAFSPLQQSQDQDQDNNLKVLPKDISQDELMAVMESFEVALNMGCNDCHAKSEKDPKKLDFKSDDHPNKEVARNMMRLVMDVNEEYFEAEGGFKDNYLYQEYAVTCITCHNGHAKPVQRISVPINFDEMER